MTLLARCAFAQGRVSSEPINEEGRIREDLLGKLLASDLAGGGAKQGEDCAVEFALARGNCFGTVPPRPRRAHLLGSAA
jgi:hypothetical protein